MDTAPAAGPALHAQIEEFYTARYDEADRLGRDAVGRLERDRTREVLARFLPAPPAHVLDVGGGPGVHAARLAEDHPELLASSAHVLAVAAAVPHGAPRDGCAGPG
jgi:ubiquinone/menaquinone biosynthesis C-methylase UbiE